MRKVVDEPATGETVTASVRVTGTPSRVRVRSSRPTVAGSTASENSTFRLATGVERTSGATASRRLTVGAARSTNTSRTPSTALTLPARSTAWATSEWRPAVSVSAAANRPSTGATLPRSSPVAASDSRTSTTSGSTSPWKLSSVALVRPSLAETPRSGTTRRFAGVAGRVVSISQVSATTPVPALPAGSVIPAPETVSVYVPSWPTTQLKLPIR